jgi:CarD family transcriptional regulator
LLSITKDLKEQMSFSVGETVVYPHHGAALIEAVTTRTIRGQERSYLKLRVAQGDLTIEVPAENVELVGVRDVVSREGLEHVFAVLRANVREEPTNWSRRYKANVEKIASGDVIKVSEVVRDLSRRDTNRGLSAGEKRMLARARQILTSELALAKEIDEEAATVVLDHVLDTPDAPEPQAQDLNASTVATDATTPEDQGDLDPQFVADELASTDDTEEPLADSVSSA